MSLERVVHVGYEIFHDAFLDVDGFEHAREARAEDAVQRVGVVQADEGGIDALGFKVIEEGSSDGTHALNVAAYGAAQRKRMEDVEKGALPAARKDIDN